MARRSFSIARLFGAVFWLACALGAFLTGDRIFRASEPGLIMLIVAVCSICLGVPGLIGLSAGGLFGHRIGFGVGLAVFGFGFTTLIGINYGTLVAVGVISAGSFAVGTSLGDRGVRAAMRTARAWFGAATILVGFVGALLMEANIAHLLGIGIIVAGGYLIGKSWTDRG